MTNFVIWGRIKTGLANARRKSKRSGRPPISDGILKKAKVLWAEGFSFRMIGRKLGIDEGTIRKRLKKKYGQQTSPTIPVRLPYQRNSSQVPRSVRQK